MSYRAEDIQVLEGIEAVRRRPGMYIGSTGKDGLHHLIYEIVANAIDESLAGFAKNIEVKILKNNRVLVSDDGRGIPVDIHPKTKKSALETVLTYLHAGGKFSQKIYKVAGGLHGVGLSVVNALSKYLKVIVFRDGYEWSQEYERGVPRFPLKKIRASQKTGTIIIFEPDSKIFNEIDFDRQIILDYLRHQNYLTGGLRINFYDERDNFSYGFYNDGGLISFLNHLIKFKKLINEHHIYHKIVDDNKELEFCFNYVELPETQELAFTNNILNPEGGTHIVGFRNALVRVFNDLAKEINIFKGNKNLITEDIRGGLYLIISIKIPEPQFEGQTKSKLGNPEVKNFVESRAYSFLKEYFSKNPQELKNILNRLLINIEAREAEKTAKESIFKKRISISLTLSGKLADCSNRDFSKRELFIVEGDSAGGSAKQARDRTLQAVLPLRGKILNVEKSNLAKILKSKEIKDLIIALGTGVGKDFNLENLRYSKIIIATDADSDGNHIRTLLLTLFYRFFKPLINGGYIYIAQPPLYKIQIGKEKLYAYNDNQKDKIIREKINKNNLNNRQRLIEVQRYKGLGEMNPEELWETTLDPNKRILKKITIEDAEKADQFFSILMGNEVEPRKKFIEIYAKEANNLDI
ncbi:MAG: DNA gyrase subunit B [Candidatus Parcubacteria bacterium]|nr:MAG: DNA gyrase subunit B [Candidatus Parcubacteria bacterium]